MRILVWSTASVLIALGFLTVLLPLPTGVPLLALGVVLILATSRAAVRWLRGHRRARARLDRAFIWIEDKSPRLFARVIRRTRPRERVSKSVKVDLQRPLE